MATRFLISASVGLDASFHHALPTDGVSVSLAVDSTHGVQTNGRETREISQPGGGRGGKKRTKSSRDCGNKKKAGASGGNGERTRETTEARGTREEEQSNFFQTSAFRGVSLFPFSPYLACLKSEVAKNQAEPSRLRANKDLRLRRPLKTIERRLAESE